MLRCSSSSITIFISSSSYKSPSSLRNLECLNLLLNTGADFNRKDSFGRFVAFNCGFGSRVCALLLSWSNLNRELSCVCFSRTPLHYAAANCNYQCLFALVGSGASVNDLDERGCTPLHYAAASDTDGKSVTLWKFSFLMEVVAVWEAGYVWVALLVMLSNGSRLERWCCFHDYSLFVVSAGAWNIYCVMMQIQGSGTIRATMLCTTPQHTVIASVWNWWELHSISISIIRYCCIVMMCNTFLLSSVLQIASETPLDVVSWICTFLPCICLEFYIWVE